MIENNVKKIIEELPQGVNLIAASKERDIHQIEKAILAGVRIVGENYVREAREKFEIIGRKVKWHFIGHLQKNKAKIAVEMFDMIESLDSLSLADALNRECGKVNKIMPVLIEVNSASEVQKYGVLPEDARKFLNEILNFKNLKPAGLMTMGPWIERAEDLRPYFKKTKDLFDSIKGSYGDKVGWDYLSMGMSGSYKVAIEEGSNMVRIGTAIFGERKYKD